MNSSQTVRDLTGMGYHDEHLEVGLLSGSLQLTFWAWMKLEIKIAACHETDREMRD